MVFQRSPKVEIVKRLDAPIPRGCDEAALILVTGGSGALAVAYGDLDPCDYLVPVALTLNGIPLTQARLSPSPTCAGMLAAGVRS